MKVDYQSNTITLPINHKEKSYRNYSYSSTSTTRNQSIPHHKTKKAIISSILKRTTYKHNSTIEIYNKNVITGIIYDDKKHIVSVFKNYLLWDETSEFLRRFYFREESTGRIPKIAGYYERYTLFAPVYAGLNENIVHIMKRFIRRKKKYLDYIEENEEKKEEEMKHGKTHHKKKHVEKFEQLIKPEMLEVTNKKKVTESTVELTVYNNNNCISNKYNTIDDCNNHNNNNKSLCSLIDDMSSHYGLIKKEDNLKYKSIETTKPIASLTMPFNSKNSKISVSMHNKNIIDKNPITAKSKVLLRPKNVTKLNLEGITNNNNNNTNVNNNTNNNNNTNLVPLSYNNSARKFSSTHTKTFTSRKELTANSKRLVLKELPLTTTQQTPNLMRVNSVNKKHNTNNNNNNNKNNSNNKYCNYSSRNNRQSSSNLDYYCNNRNSLTTRRRNTKLTKNVINFNLIPGKESSVSKGKQSQSKGKKKLILVAMNFNKNNYNNNIYPYINTETQFTNSLGKRTSGGGSGKSFSTSKTLSKLSNNAIYQALQNKKERLLTNKQKQYALKKKDYNL